MPDLVKQCLRFTVGSWARRCTIQGARKHLPVSKYCGSRWTCGFRRLWRDWPQLRHEAPHSRASVAPGRCRLRTRPSTRASVDG